MYIGKGKGGNDGNDDNDNAPAIIRNVRILSLLIFAYLGWYSQHQRACLLPTHSPRRQDCDHADADAGETSPRVHPAING